MKDEQHPGGWDDLRIDGTPVDSAALSRLLAAASAPGSPSDLAGEDAALAAFRAAAPVPAGEAAVPDGALPDRAADGIGGAAPAPGPRARRRRMRGRPLGKRAVKIAVAVCALLSAGGVAVAAGTGALPGAHPAEPPARRSPAPAQQDGRLRPGPRRRRAVRAVALHRAVRPRRGGPRRHAHPCAFAR
ncbi:hypothetical protein ACQEU3_17855 [Spirillospora sp. CA-253888]